jgi:hypothetical protein
MAMYVQTFTVTGSMSFPLDMLRYDACWPSSQDDVGELIAACGHYRERPKPNWRITLTRYIRKGELPTFDRCHSAVKSKQVRLGRGLYEMDRTHT